MVSQKLSRRTGWRLLMLGSRSGTLAAMIVPRSATADAGQCRENLAKDHLEDERQNRGHERDPDDRLIHVGHGGPARDPARGSKNHRSPERFPTASDASPMR